MKFTKSELANLSKPKETPVTRYQQARLSVAKSIAEFDGQEFNLFHLYLNRRHDLKYISRSILYQAFKDELQEMIGEGLVVEVVAGCRGRAGIYREAGHEEKLKRERLNEIAPEMERAIKAAYKHSHVGLSRKHLEDIIKKIDAIEREQEK
jgi:hypothetical protein